MVQRVCRKCGAPAVVKRDPKVLTITCTGPLCRHTETKVFTSKGG
jgi:hypothetical protein